MIGLDLGFGYTKATDGRRVLNIPSVVGEGAALYDYAADHLSLWHEGRELFIGDAAIKQSDIRYYSLRDHKAENWASEILARAALAWLAQGRDATIDLVTGLPFDMWAAQRQDLQEAMAGIAGRVKIRVGRDIHEQSVAVNRVKIVPQPLGSILDQAVEADGKTLVTALATKAVCVIDVGTYTLNLLALHGLEILRPLSRSVPLGMHLVHSAVARELGGIPLYEADRRIRLGRVRCEDALRAAAEAINQEVESLNAEFDLHLITGGGGEALYPWLLPGRKTMKVPDAQMGNVRGYLKLGRRLWSST